MKLLNRMTLFVVGAGLIGLGAAAGGRGLGVWGESGDVVLPSDIVVVLRANPWGTRLAAVVAAATCAGALWLLAANLVPRSRALGVARHRDGLTVIRTSSLLDTVRHDVRHYAKLSQVRASMAGRIGRPRVNLWVTVNPSDSPRKLLDTVGETIAPRLREAVADDQLPVSTLFRFAPKLAHPEKKGRASVS